MNQYKSKFFPHPVALTNHRLSISSEELSEYWNSLTLTEMERILVIHDQFLICQILVGEYLQYYLNNKKVSSGEYFYVMYKQKILLWVYDAKIFRQQQQNNRSDSDNWDADNSRNFTYKYKDAETDSFSDNNKRINSNNLTHKKYGAQFHPHAYSSTNTSANSTKQNNDLISTFMVSYREDRGGQKPQNDSEQIFQFLDFDSITKEGQWALKVKQSALMRIFPYLLQRLDQSGKKVKYPISKSTVSTQSQKYQKYQEYSTSHKGYHKKQSKGGKQCQSRKRSSNYLPQDESYPPLHQIILLQPSQYGLFVYNSLPPVILKHPLYSPQVLVNPLFNLITHLMLNNLLISWYNDKISNGLHSEKLIEDYHFNRYFRSIAKPKLKEEFTTMNENFTQIEWQSFKIYVFQLKYHINQTQDFFYCYQKQWKQDELLVGYYKYVDYFDQILELQSQHNQKFDPQERQGSQYQQEEVTISESITQNLLILKAFHKRQKQSEQLFGFGYRTFGDECYDQSNQEDQLLAKLLSKSQTNQPKDLET